MLRQPSNLWYKEDMTDIMETCVIMHNMTVKVRKAGYTGTRKQRVAAEEAEAAESGASVYHELVPPTKPVALVNWLHEVSGQVDNHKHNNDLKMDLKEHMYARDGHAVAVESSGDDFE